MTHAPRGGVLLAAMLLVLLAIPAWGAKPAASTAPALTPTQIAADGPQVFEVTEVIPRSERTMARLREIREKLDADKSIDIIDAELPQWTRQLDEWWKTEGPTLRESRSMQRANDLAWELTQRFGQIEAWKRLLVDSGKEWIAETQALDRGIANWQATRTTLRADAPPTVRERIDEVLREIEAVQRLFREKTARLIATQGQLAAQNDALNPIRKELEAVHLRSTRGLFSLDSPPLWTALFGTGDSQIFSAQVGAAWSKFSSEILDLFQFIRVSVALQVASFIGVLGLFLLLRRLSHQAGNVQPTVTEQIILDRSFFSAFLLTLGLIPLLYPDLSPRLMRLVILPGVLPVLALVPAIFAPRLRAGFYIFTALFLLDFLRNYLPPQWPLARLLLLSVSSLGAVGTAILLLQQRRQRAAEQSTRSMLYSLTIVGMVLSLGSAVANLAGNLTLAEFMVSPPIRLIFLAVTIRLGVVVTTTLAVMALRSPIAMLSLVIRERGEAAAMLVRRGAVLVGVGLWIYLALFNLGQLAAIKEGMAAIMETEWQLGAAVIPVRDIVIFLLVMFSSYLISHMLRVILIEEIFPRIRFPRGVPDALALLARYGVLLFGFLLALSSAGVDLSKVTLALSALGVGIGFGLQNVVNNFVCGLILVFEHPIQVGDTIEVGPHYGRVVRIGFRSCVLLTGDGSEVVIPNAELIGHKVVNWSLSNSMRRLNIAVPVAIGADTTRVIDLLQSVARACPLVRTEPPPRAVLEHFDNSALKIVLQCWVRTEQMGAARDELTVAIDHAFRGAGIRMPFPQSDVHLHFPDPEPIRVAPANVSGEGGEIQQTTTGMPGSAQDRVKTHPPPGFPQP